MPPKRKATSYATRAASRRRVVETNSHPSHLTVHPAAGENQQGTSGMNQAPAQEGLNVNTDWLANLGKNIAAAVQKSLQDAGISVTNPQTPSQPEIQFVPDAPQANNTDSHPQDTASMTHKPVEAVVRQVTSNLVEGPKEAPTCKNSFVSVAVPLTHRVSDKVKKQIWGNEYVDFAVIFHHSSTNEDHYTFKVQNEQGGGQPTLSLVPSVKKQPVHNIDQWTAAFQAFVAVYCERFPSETAQLMKYGATVRDLAQRGANWKFYDDNYRMLRQSALIPWDQIHSELWLRASVPKVKQPIPAKSTTKQSGSFFPRGFCWTFLRGGNCTGCEFKHQCSKCGLNHPLSRCQQNQKHAGQRPNHKPGLLASNSFPHSAAHTSQG